MGRAQRADRQTHRTPNDVSSLCVELLRAVRERELRAREPRGPAQAVDRAWRAWRTDLERHGPLHLVAEGGGIREGESGPPLGRGRLHELARRLAERSLPSVRFEPGLDAPTWSAFVSLLVIEPEEVAAHGGALAFLPERGVGIRIVGGGPGAEAEEEEKPDEDLPADLSPQRALHLAAAPATQASATPLEAAAPAPGALATPLEAAAPAPGALAAPPEAAAPATQAIAAPAEAIAPAPDAAAEASLPAAPARERGSADPDATQPVIPPLSEPPGLSALLTSRNDRAFLEAVDQTVAEAIAASESGDAESCHQAVLQLSEAASEEGLHSDTQRDVALDGLRKLCSGRRLAALIERAAAGDRNQTLRCGRVLLQLAEQAAPALLSAIDVQRDPARRQDLVAILVALGRAATPALRRAMEGSSPQRARLAARMAGDVRDARAVPTLAKLLHHEDADVRGEAARALARIGNVSALITLKRGLESPHEEVSTLCAWSLGAAGTADAAEALTETLRQARRERRLALAAAVIRSLGNLGREEAVPELRTILEKRSFFRRQELRELKLQAVEALARLPGDAARELLEEIATGSDMSLAVAARRAMKALEEGAG